MKDRHCYSYGKGASLRTHWVYKASALREEGRWCKIWCIPFWEFLIPPPFTKSTPPRFLMSEFGQIPLIADPCNWGRFQPPEYDLGLEWFQFWILLFCERACKALLAHNPFRHYLWDGVWELFNIIGNYWKLAHQRPDKHGQIIYYGNQLNSEVRFQPPRPACPKGHRPLVPFEVSSRNRVSSSAGIAWGGRCRMSFLLIFHLVNNLP